MGLYAFPGVSRRKSLLTLLFPIDNNEVSSPPLAPYGSRMLVPGVCPQGGVSRRKSLLTLLFPIDNNEVSSPPLAQYGSRMLVPGVCPMPSQEYHAGNPY